MKFVTVLGLLFLKCDMPETNESLHNTQNYAEN